MMSFHCVVPCLLKSNVLWKFLSCKTFQMFLVIIAVCYRDQSFNFLYVRPPHTCTDTSAQSSIMRDSPAVMGEKLVSLIGVVEAAYEKAKSLLVAAASERQA